MFGKLHVAIFYSMSTFVHHYKMTSRIWVEEVKMNSLPLSQNTSFINDLLWPTGFRLRVFLFSGKKKKKKWTLEHGCATPRHCLYFYFESILFIHKIIKWCSITMSFFLIQTSFDNHIVLEKFSFQTFQHVVFLNNFSHPQSNLKF